MRITLILLLVFYFLNGIALSNDELYDNPIDLKTLKTAKLDDFCIDKVDIEKYIKKELNDIFIPVSLDECIDIALKNNLDIQIAHHDYKSSKYEYEYSLSKLLPDFTTQSYISDYRGQILVGGVLNDRFHETAISINLTLRHDLTKGTEDIFKIKASKYFEKTKKHRENYTKSQVIYYTTKYYYELVLSKLNIEIYLRNLLERNAQLAITLAQQSVGKGTKFNVLRSQNESSQAKVALLNSINQFTISQSKLADIMGVDINSCFMPIETSVKELSLYSNDLTIEELIKLVLDNREDLKEFKASINYERQIKNIYKTEFIPKPYVTYQQQFQGTISDDIHPNYILSLFIDWIPGLNISLGTISKIKSQNEKIEAKKLDMQNKLRDILILLNNSLSNLKFYKKEIELNKNRITYTHEGVELATFGFKEGDGILIDVIEAQNEATLARVQYISSIINYNLTQLDILYCIGKINKDIILSNYNP